MRADLRRRLDSMMVDNTPKKVFKEIQWSEFEWRERWYTPEDSGTEDEIWYVTFSPRSFDGGWWFGHKSAAEDRLLPKNWFVLCGS